MKNEGKSKTDGVCNCWAPRLPHSIYLFSSFFTVATARSLTQRTLAALYPHEEPSPLVPESEAVDGLRIETTGCNPQISHHPVQEKIRVNTYWESADPLSRHTDRSGPTP